VALKLARSLDMRKKFPDFESEIKHHSPITIYWFYTSSYNFIIFLYILGSTMHL